MLIVGDDDDSREMLAELVGMLGFDALRAANGKEALHHVENAEPALALVDIGLPEVDGYEVARRLRAHPHGRRSAWSPSRVYSDLSVREAATLAGFDDFVVKPVLPEALEKLLRSVAG